jgi:hypothetical protein
LLTTRRGGLRALIWERGAWRIGADVTRGASDALAGALGSARDEQLAGGNQIAADKLSAVFELVNVARRKERPSPAAVASEARVALERVGAGGDDAVADALLKAV